jgi:tight adherence protein B
MLLMKLVVLGVVFGGVALGTLGILGLVVPFWNRVTARYVGWIMAEHARMFRPIAESRAQQMVAASTLGAVVAGYLIGGPVAAVLFGAVGGALPYGWVRYLQHQRVLALDNQLVDALILMANGLRSGLSLLQAIELADQEMKPPIADEIGRLLNEVRLGRPIDDALVGMADRLGLPDLEIAVHSIVTLRETGGNLSETFMTVANTIVERKKVEGKIRSLTAQGVYQGAGLCAMPFAFGLLFYVMDPAYMRPMFTTWLGWSIWAVVVILDALGMWMILKITKIDV